MDFFTHIREAISNLLSSKLRSLLAILGILVGTGSVVSLVMSSQAATNHALAQFKSLGTNIISASIQSPSMSSNEGNAGAFTLDMLPDIWKASSQLVYIAPYISLYKSIYVKGISTSSQVLGVTDDFFKILKITIHRGRLISVLDHVQLFCIIGSKLAKKIRDAGNNPIGQQIMVGKVMFTIIGVLNSWKPNMFVYANIDNGIVIPLKAAHYLSKNASIHSVLFRTKKKSNVLNVQAKLAVAFRQVAPSARVHFRNPQNVINIVEKSRATFSMLLACIGGISLLVGGIGVMNIMLVSVVERKREIGIRMALGAKRRDIKMMFLIESIFLTVFGGIMGILIGVGVSITISELSHWGFQFFWTPPVLGFAVSVLVGIVSGYYPALRASKLDPIQTLQSD